MGTSGTVFPADRALRWNSTIDRTLVHRNSVSEVLLTDIVPVTGTDFLVGAQWPRSHRVYRPDSDGRHDPMLLLETVRQVGLALSHSAFGVGPEQRSMMRDLEFRLDPRVEPRALGAATDVSVGVRCEDVTMRGAALKGMTVVLFLSAAGQPFATGTGTIRWLPSDSYARFRARSGLRDDWRDRFPEAPGPDRTHSASIAGQPTDFRTEADSLIAAQFPVLSAVEVVAPGSRKAVRQLLVPVDHPVYFDHPLDHVPGMVLIDAAWQAVLAMRPGFRARLLGCSMDCPAFTELDAAANLEVELSALTGTALFEVRQRGKVTAAGTLRLSR